MVRFKVVSSETDVPAPAAAAHGGRGSAVAATATAASVAAAAATSGPGAGTGGPRNLYPLQGVTAGVVRSARNTAHSCHRTMTRTQQHTCTQGMAMPLQDIGLTVERGTYPALEAVKLAAGVFSIARVLVAASHLSVSGNGHYKHLCTEALCMQACRVRTSNSMKAAAPHMRQHTNLSELLSELLRTFDSAQNVADNCC